MQQRMMSPLAQRLLLLLVCLTLPVFGVEKVRSREYRKDPDADKVRHVANNSVDITIKRCGIFHGGRTLWASVLRPG